MNTMLDTSDRLAQALRTEREARGWSQAELAARSGVSKAMISKVERGEASPTASVLVKLASAFELTLATLLMQAERAGGRLARAAQQPAWRDPATGYVRRQIFARPDHPVELVRVALPAGARVPLPAASYAFIRQVVWALEGEVTVEDGAERHVLCAGDAYGFGDPADSAFVNETAHEAVYLVAVSRR